MADQYTIKITDITGHVSVVRRVDADTWNRVRDSAVTGTPMVLSYTDADRGLPIQIQWGRNSIARAELIPE
jgi:hypothetical protein